MTRDLAYSRITKINAPSQESLTVQKVLRRATIILPVTYYSITKKVYAQLTDHILIEIVAKKSFQAKPTLDSNPELLKAT